MFPFSESVSSVVLLVVKMLADIGNTSFDMFRGLVNLFSMIMELLQ